jgi:hypothetical protein
MAVITPPPPPPNDDDQNSLAWQQWRYLLWKQISATLSGTGTANKVPKFTSAHIIGDSSRSDNGTVVNETLPVGFGIAPTALIHIKAGTAAAGTAPLKFTNGALTTTAEAGALEYDGNSLHFTPLEGVRKSVMLSTDVVLATTTVANTVTETTIYTATLAANELSAGKVIQLQGYGRYSTANGTDTWAVKVYVGAAVVATINSSAANVTNTPFDAKVIFTCRTSGVTGTVWSYARVSSNRASLSNPGTSATTVDTTISNILKVTITWSSANAGNTFSLDQGYREIIDA